MVEDKLGLLQLILFKLVTKNQKQKVINLKKLGIYKL